MVILPYYSLYWILFDKLSRVAVTSLLFKALVVSCSILFVYKWTISLKSEISFHNTAISTLLCTMFTKGVLQRGCLFTLLCLWTENSMLTLCCWLSSLILWKQVRAFTELCSGCCLMSLISLAKVMSVLAILTSTTFMSVYLAFMSSSQIKRFQ